MLIFIILIIIVIMIMFCSKKQSKVIDLNKAKKYMINLERRKDRLKTTMQKLENKGYKNIIRYPAIDGKKLQEYEIINMVHRDSIKPIFDNKRTKHNQLSYGAVGCYLSHAKLWNIIEQEVDEYAVIFEDDTNPTIIQSELENILLDIPDNWDIILLGCIHFTKPKEILSKFNKVNRFMCLHAYIINKKAVKKIKSNKLYPIKDQIDWYLSDLSEKGLLNIYSIKDSEWYQNTDVSFTDIQTPIKNN